MEDIWALIALPFFLIFPFLAIVIVVMLLVVAIASRKLINWMEDRRRYACPSCAHEVLPTASACSACKTVVEPKEILSWNVLFGRRVPNAGEGDVETDVLGRHRLRLLSRRRCPNCAERVDPKAFPQKGCGQCGFTFNSIGYDDWFDDYRTEVIGRGIRLVLPLMLLSWIPAVGIALAIVAVKIFVTAPLRMFLGGFSRFGLKWGMRIFTIILLILGSLPFVSLVAVPVVILVHIWIYGTFAKRKISDVNPDRPSSESDSVSNVQGV